MIAPWGSFTLAILQYALHRTRDIFVAKKSGNQPVSACQPKHFQASIELIDA